MDAAAHAAVTPSLVTSELLGASFAHTSANWSSVTSSDATRATNTTRRSCLLFLALIDVQIGQVRILRDTGVVCNANWKGPMVHDLVVMESFPT